MQTITPITGDLSPLSGPFDFQQAPEVIQLTGGTVMVFSEVSSQDLNGVIGQRFSDAGAKIGEPVVFRNGFELSFNHLAATALTDGGFALTYQTIDGDSGVSNVLTRSFDADGTPRSPEAAAFGDITMRSGDFDIVARPGGGYTIAGTGFTSEGFDAIVRSFDATGAPVTDTERLANSTRETQRATGIDALDDGTLLVTWQERDIWGQRIDATGALSGTTFLISPSGSAAQAATIGANGNILVAWTQFVSGQFDILARIISPAGEVLIDTFTVNTFTDGNQFRVDAERLPDGTALVAWVDDSDRLGEGTDIYGQRISAAGTNVGPEFRINAQIPGDQSDIDIEVLSSGRIAIGFSDRADNAQGGTTATSELRFFATESAPPAPIVGTTGPDRLDGTAGNDEIIGLAGNDVLRGFTGDDTLNGGPGADTLNGGGGDDFIFGGSSPDDLRDVIFGGAGDDSIDAGAGNDEVYGQDGNDTIAGGAGVDTLQGQNGDDVITGSNFSDLIFGNAGDDFVNGGFGSDRINGGTGADRFFHVGVEGHGSDWLQDYSFAEGDVLLYGGTATRDQFQVNFANTAGAGDAGVAEAFVIFRPTDQILWALVDGAGEAEITLLLNGQEFDLLG